MLSLELDSQRVELFLDELRGKNWAIVPTL
jgi:hypothetical protein